MLGAESVVVSGEAEVQTDRELGCPHPEKDSREQSESQSKVNTAKTQCFRELTTCPRRPAWHGRETMTKQGRYVKYGSVRLAGHDRSFVGYDVPVKPRGVVSSGLLIVLLSAFVGLGCSTSDEGSEAADVPSASGGNSAQNQNDGGPTLTDAANGSLGTGGTEEPAGSGGSGESTNQEASTPSLDAGQDAADAASVTTDDAEASLDATSDASEPGQDSALPSSWPDGKYITPDEVHERLEPADPDMLLVNVVDEMFYNLGHLAGSLKIPWDTLADNLAQLDPSRHIVIYCRKGVRSESAYETLTSNGYSLVWIMEGGVEAWTSAGYSTVPE